MAMLDNGLFDLCLLTIIGVVWRVAGLHVHAVVGGGSWYLKDYKKLK